MDVLSHLTPDLEALDALLMACPDEDGAMLMGELDGYLAGVLVSPHSVPQAQWLRETWGGHEQAFPGDAERSARLVALILARKAQMAGELLAGNSAYAPIFDIDERDEDDVLWEIWAEGFARAMALGGKDWGVLLETGDALLDKAALEIMRYVAVARGADIPMSDAVPPDVAIPYLVETIYRCQHGLSAGAADDLPYPIRQAPVARPKVGRNAPCPCGSGKKYKKCCGA